MRRRLYIKNADLEDRDGRKYGKVRSLTLELDLEALAVEPAKPAIESVDSDEVASIWEHYVAVMKPRKTDLDPQTRAVIRDALKLATSEECCRAIDGCFASDFHMKRGEYAARKPGRYNAVTQILKGKRGGRTTREQIDFFLDIAERSSDAAFDPSEDPVRIRDAKNDVLAAHEFPEDEHLAERGKRAQEWLQERGWMIGARAEDGWPTFAAPGQ